MNTWSFKRPLCALVLFATAACGNTGGVIGNIGAVENTAVPQAQMAFGAVTLIPPKGYCVDTRTLSQQFAMLARCDVLGAPDDVSDTPLGMIAVSFADVGEADTLPSPEQTAQALGLTEVSDQVVEEDRVFFRANGQAPIRQMAPQHWRGNALIAGYVVGLALYGPKGGRALSAEGQNLLNTLVSQTQVSE